MTRPVSVRGGAGGVEAHYDDLAAAARLFGRAAGDTGEVALALHGYLVHPAVLGSAVLDPGGVAEFERRLLVALDGPAGVTWLSARCAGVDVGLRATAAAYLGADRLDARLAPELGAVGRQRSRMHCLPCRKACLGYEFRLYELIWQRTLASQMS